MQSQAPVDFEDALLEIDPGDMGWRITQLPGEHWGLDSLDPISGHYSLHHVFDSDQAGCDYFIMHHDPFRRSRAGDPVFSGDSLSFTFRVRHAYKPSSGNNWQVAILADFEGGIKAGIVAGVNLVGSDDLVKIWRARDGIFEELCTSRMNYQEEIGTLPAPLFRISWQWDGMLKICYAPDTSSEMLEIASCFMDDLPDGRSVVIRYEYSSAQDRKLWLDDFHLEGKFEADALSPVVTGWKLEKSNILILDFSEAIILSDSRELSLAQTGSPGEPMQEHRVYPDSIAVDECRLQIYFPEPLPNREAFILMVRGICDQDGNCMRDTLLPIMRNEAEWGDLVISEVMADPDPPVLQSFDEYVELYNRSGYLLHLEGWFLMVGDRKYELIGQEDDPMLQPGEYRLIRPLSLSNHGSLLALYSMEGTLVHAASYRIPYDAPQWKKEGGWSLESPDPDRLCNLSQLWEYSIDRKGGTPGEENSVRGEHPDKKAPVLLYYGIDSEDIIALYFNEMIRLVDERSDEVVLDPGNYHAVELREVQPVADRLLCRFALDLSVLSHFVFRMPAVSDCSGNLSKALHFTGGGSKDPDLGSVFINEIMFDPLEGKAEFVELFNPGPNYVDIRKLGLNVTDEEGEMDDLVPLSDHSRMMGPGDYLVLTENIDHLMDSYGLDISGQWVELRDFKSLPDGGGRIWLCDRAGNVIDAVSYNEGMHLELITDTRGISLERINYERFVDDPQTWHSAASIEGYATPGRRNSQTPADSDLGHGLVLDPRVFSPDNDGFNDLLVIYPGIQEPGWVLRLWITKPDGMLVRMLANNHVAGVSSCYTWDGRNEKGQMAAEGFYVVHLRAYHPGSGSGWNLKKAVGLVD